MQLILKTGICHMAKSAGDEKHPPFNSTVLSSVPQAPPLPVVSLTVRLSQCHWPCSLLHIHPGTPSPLSHTPGD